MAKKTEAVCRRSYDLGTRREQSGRKRAAILRAARLQLESRTFLNLTMESLARESGVTRQTVHNLFGTKTGVLEALFDQLATDGGMERMRGVMREPDPDLMLAGFVEVFTHFWAKNRLLIRRIHAIAALDPDLCAVVEFRNKRRQMAATRLVEQLARRSAACLNDPGSSVSTLCALTSFEFFDSLAETCSTQQDPAQLVLRLTRRALDRPDPLHAHETS